MQRWLVGVSIQPRGALLNPCHRLASAGSRASQHSLHLGAGLSIPLDYLLDVFLLLPLQNAQEVLQLRHGEGMPLGEEKNKNE